MIRVLTAYFRTPRVHIAALVYFLFAGILTQTPLFNYLGYEFSAVITIPAAFISGTLTILFLREHRKLPLTRRTWLSVILDYLLINGILLFVPLIVISLNAIVIKNCAFGKGISYYVLLPVITMLFSVSLALVLGTLFRRGILVFWLSVIAILSHLIVITVTQPQLFAYNFILGFFPGITYDETLTNISSLIIYRQFTVLASILLMALFIVLLRNYSLVENNTINFHTIKKNLVHDKVLWVVIVLCALILAAAHLYRDVLGYEFSESDIQQRLGRRTESNHFVFFYYEKDYSVSDMLRIKAESEFHYRKVTDMLETLNRNGAKIEVYIYPDGEWKQRYIGTTNTNIAKPWKRQIHLTKATFLSTFRHELVHIAAAEFGFPLIKASTRMGLNEGLAVAIDWDEGLFSPHQFAAALLRENGLDHVERLFSYSGFAVQSSSYAYLVSGSFSRYLIERFGIQRFRRTFSNGNFVSSFGESLESLIKDWKSFLKTIDCTEIPTETVRTLFFQKSIFYKTCAREVADQNQRALAAIRVNNFGDAEKEFNASYVNAPTAYALRGIFQTLNAQQRPKEVIRMFAELPEQSSLKTNPSVSLLHADAYYLSGHYDTARTLYQKLRSLNYSESFIEAVALRLQCMQDRIDYLTFHSLFFEGMRDSVKIPFIQKVIAAQGNSEALNYLNAVLAEDTSRARMNLLKSLALHLSSSDLKYFVLVRSAQQMFSFNRFEEAKSLFWQAKNVAPTSAIGDYLDERIELCDFAALEVK